MPPRRLTANQHSPRFKKAQIQFFALYLHPHQTPPIFSQLEVYYPMIPPPALRTEFGTQRTENLASGSFKDTQIIPAW